jgi:hypothetical protein
VALCFFIQEYAMSAQSVFRRSLLGLSFVLVLVNVPLAQEKEFGEIVTSSHVLDGRNYFGQNGSKGKPADHDDEFIFKDGMFRSTSCDKYGFKEGRYETTESGGIIYFKAATASPSHGQMFWEGQIDGDSLKGTFLWTKERWYWDIRKEYWFKAELKQ